MEVRLTRIESNNTFLRTNIVEGRADVLPIVGRRFSMRGPGLEIPGSTRLVSTSPVERIIEDESGVRFWTANSEYYLEMLNGYAN